MPTILDLGEMDNMPVAQAEELEASRPRQGWQVQPRQELLMLPGKREGQRRALLLLKVLLSPSRPPRSQS